MSPTLELTAAIVARLKATSAVTAIVGARVYDHVPRSPASGEITAQYPFIGLGPSSELDDDADGIAGVEIPFRIEVWSRAVGFPEALRIADAVKRAIHQQDMDLTQNALVQIRLARMDKNRDPDGLTSHVTLEFIALIETP